MNQNQKTGSNTMGVLGDRLPCKSEALSSNQKVDGSRLTGSIETFRHEMKDIGDGIAPACNENMSPLWCHGSQLKDPSPSLSHD